MPEDTTKSKADEALEELEEDLKELGGDIARSHKVGLDSLKDPGKVSLFQAHLQRLDSTYDKFETRYLEVKRLVKKLGQKLDRYATYKEKIQTLYFDSLAMGIPKEESKLNVSVPNPQLSSPCKLPTIDLPRFTGDVFEWPSFKDVYVSLVHDNAELSPVQKFHYLKSTLKGTAAHQITAIPIGNAEYQQAWDTICLKYDNKRTQATNYLARIFNFKPIGKLNLDSLENFSAIVLGSAQAFMNLNLEDPAGFILTTFLIRLLDPKTREHFENKIGGPNELPNLKGFSDFLHNQSIKLQTSVLNHIPNPQLHVPPTFKTAKGTVLVSVNAAENGQCPLCKEKHRLMFCQKFLKLAPNQRFDKVKTWNRCINCFGVGHRGDKCPSNFSCRSCQRRHHTLLHFENQAPNGSAGKQYPRSQNHNSPVEIKDFASGSNTSPIPKQTISSHHTSSRNESTPSSEQSVNILLATARARILTKSGNFLPIRILIDSGSQRSFIIADCAKKLNLPRCHNSQRLVGLGQQPIAGGNQQVSVTIVPENRENPKLSTKAIIMERICENTPSYPIATEATHYLKLRDLADPTFAEPGPIDFLMGADLFGEIFQGGSLVLPDSCPHCFNTIFGWVLMGKVSAPSPSENLTLFVIEPPSEEPCLKELFENFWKVEEVESVSRVDPMDIKCEEHFLQTHSRDSTGRYIVQLPFRDEFPILGDSKTGALTRFHKLEHRLLKEPNLRIKYNDVFSEYLQNNYLSPTLEPGKWYLPHQAVIKNDSEKIRVVFDASHSTSKGSLNDALMQGPKLQKDIKDILLRFRNPRYAIATDIVQMYSQILVHDKDRAYQHLYFRFDANEAIIDYTFNRVMFGMTCSPFIALRVIQQLITDEGAPFPVASKALEKNIYMDDILAGGNTIEATLELQQQLIEMLKKGGFSLKKWSSNDEQLLSAIPAESRSNQVTLSDLEDSVVKILGMKWETHDDSLSYKIQMRDCAKTKRGILSTIARMYDPLGYLAPVIFKAKTLLQKLWQLNINWDETLPSSIASEWETFLNEIPTLSSIAIPRCILSQNPKDIKIMGFADASSLGYAAVVYLWIQPAQGPIVTHLLYAKTRLAPIKPVSIPRLELCAALLLATVMRSLGDYFASIQTSGTYLFSDSKIVLSWLKIPYHNLKIFVANRVAKILDLTPLSAWHHVKSEQNMADIASRGINPQALTTKEDWWVGGEWLRLPVSEWPITSIQSQEVEKNLPETKELTVLYASPAGINPEDMVKKFSSFTRMLRVLTYAYRWKKYKRGETSFGQIKLTEINETLSKLVIQVQRHHFQGNYNLKYRSLDPFVDPQGVLRVGGRLAHAPMPENSRHPILLPNKSDFVNLLVDHLHRTYAHAGPQLLLSMIRQKYWIVAGRRLVRQRTHMCLRCHRLAPQPFSYKMSNLPPSRFAQGRAFINVGIDFAGPFMIKESSRRKAALGKAYFCVFVCMSTKAVHIELVSSLSTEAFLACLDRFVARRGIPSKILSDNGRNFLGAQRHLKEIFEWWANEANQTKVEGNLRNREITWEFIPPGAPHFGGLWEAAVKSLKFHLRRILGQQPLTFEELSTVGSRVEAVLNSRPLHPLSSDPEDLNPLTPGHFLTGAPLLAVPEPDWTDTRSNLLSRWQFLEQSIQDVWKKWKSDYLSGLQQRVKWTGDHPNLQKDTMVVVTDTQTPPLSWTVGRIIDILPGKDGIVRVAKIKTTMGEYTRPVARLAPLFPQGS